MSTLNISLPDAMRKYVETQAELGHFTASEYVRHLIRMDQERKEQEKRAQIAQYLALCEQQIAEGKSHPYSRERIVAKAARLKSGNALK